MLDTVVYCSVSQCQSHSKTRLQKCQRFRLAGGVAVLNRDKSICCQHNCNLIICRPGEKMRKLWFQCSDDTVHTDTVRASSPQVRHHMYTMHIPSQKPLANVCYSYKVAQRLRKCIQTRFCRNF